MSHEVDGYDLTFTSRTSWKAERRRGGKLIDVVPVTWTKGIRGNGKIEFLEVWLRSKELKEYNSRTEPFVVALAIAKDYNQTPHSFQEFRGLFEVQATGTLLSDRSIETRVLRRIKRTD
jgi:hypothetical protein